MRIVTIERFGRLDPGEQSGYVYAGDAWLLRFLIQDPTRFFAAELPRMVHLLDIDPRQIMRLTHYGSPGSGLRQAEVILSLSPGQEPPIKSTARFDPDAATVLDRDGLVYRLQERVEDPGPADCPGDQLSDRFEAFLRAESTAAKRRIAEAIRREEENEAR